MSENVFDFAQFIGVEKTIHRIEVNRRAILYTDPTLEALPAISKMGQSGGTFGSIYEAGLKVFRGQTFEDEQPFTEEWLDGVSLGDFMFFCQFMQNPSLTERPTYAEPLTLKNFRGHDITLPPITLGNVKAFHGFLNSSKDQTQAELVLEQLDTAFEKATLEDGSSVPEGFTAGLTLAQAQALITRWISGPAETEVTATKKASGSGGRRKPESGLKRRRSSAKPSASASSEATQTTSEDSG